jgi:tetraacyldisaccharide 4'-kinase
VLILDDGFQHLRLARDLDIVLLDAERPFSNGRLLPRGPLRERPDAVERADMLVFNYGSRPDGDPPPSLPEVGYEIPRIGIAVVPTTIGPASGGARLPSTSIGGQRVALLAAISRPHRFEKTVKDLGATVVLRAFYRDHARLSRFDIEAFARAAAERHADILLTTEKDAARIPVGAAEVLHSLAIEHRVIQGRSELDRALQEIARKARRGGGAEGAEGAEAKAR